tara:strand:- start:1303 stop:1860 length:558 start_codon:yes stop_codon:yes gene_type:complete
MKLLIENWRKFLTEEEVLVEKCWDGYRQAGLKKKGDRMVPNCVPIGGKKNEASTGFDLAKSIAYTAFVLDDSSHQKLAQMAPEGWSVYAHHMTMIPPTEQKQRLPPSQFFEGCIKIVGIARNEMVIAAKVDLGEMAIYNKIDGIPHITIATNAGGKPVMSNDFSDADFEPVKPITVCGKVEEVPK